MESSKKGFTLIELVIVITIIAIIAAIAIPSLINSRLRANEATAVTCIKQYNSAQVQFQTSQAGRLATNCAGGATAYADNFRNLFYGNPVGHNTANLILIGDSFANAFIMPTFGIATNKTPLVPAASSPYQGYYFREPHDALGVNYYATGFALLAVPAMAGRTGSNYYCSETEGIVWLRSTATTGAVAVGTTGAYDQVATPITNRTDWTTL